MTPLKPTDGLILTALFLKGTVRDGRVHYTDGVRHRVPKASEDALSDALARLVRADSEYRSGRGGATVRRHLRKAPAFAGLGVEEVGDAGSHREAGQAGVAVYNPRLMRRRRMEADWARPVVQWEIRAIDPEKMGNFYRTMFNWDIVSGKKAMYIRPGIGAPEPQIAGAMLPSERSGITLAIQRNLRDSMNRAVELGGKILREPFDVGPTPATFAWIEDPEGNHLTLVQQ